VGGGDEPVDELFTGMHCDVLRAGRNDWTQPGGVRRGVVYSWARCSVHSSLGIKLT
jgi:hypothetical protein